MLIGGVVQVESFGADGVASQGLRRPTALVIGNARYGFPGSTLRNPANDATWVAQNLERRGFDVTRLTDVTTAQMAEAIARLELQSRHKEISLFYFAGHAVSVDGVNYLFGVDLPGSLTQLTISQAQQHGLALRRVSQALRRSGVRARILVIDACRTALTRGFAPQLSRSVPAGGELIAYSTQPGATAEDGFGEKGPANSPYSYFFGHGLANAGGDMPVESFFKQLTADVQVATAARQIPHYESSLVGEVRLGSLGDAWTTAVPPTARQAAGLKRGSPPLLGRDLIRRRMADWEREIEQVASNIDVPGAEALRQRARVGDVIAMTTLGLIEEKGGLGKPDMQRAARWYRLAAGRQFAPAQTYLGELTVAGRGVPKDLAAAEHLFRQAEAAGHQRAALDRLDLRLRAGQPLDVNSAGATLLDALGLRHQGPRQGVPP